MLLLCSDGLTGMIDEAEVAGDPRGAGRRLGDAGRALVAAANEAGGRDNITVVLFRLEDVRRATADADGAAWRGRDDRRGRGARDRAAPADGPAPPSGPGPATRAAARLARSARERAAAATRQDRSPRPPRPW